MTQPVFSPETARGGGSASVSPGPCRGGRTMFTSVWRSLRQFFPSAERVIPVLSIAGLAFLAFVLGAVAMHYRLPAVEPLRKSFDGAAAWWERVANQGRAA